jgi:hypothetical protein
LPPDSAVINLLDFVNTRIKWLETYPLEPPRPKFYERYLISGSFITESEQGNFKGKIGIWKNETDMRYEWDITLQNEELLAAKSSLISFEQMPKDSDQFEFVRNYVFNEIREYKVKDKKIVSRITFRLDK